MEKKNDSIPFSCSVSLKRLHLSTLWCASLNKEKAESKPFLVGWGVWNVLLVSQLAGFLRSHFLYEMLLTTDPLVLPPQSEWIERKSCSRCSPVWMVWSCFHENVWRADRAGYGQRSNHTIILHSQESTQAPVFRGTVSLDKEVHAAVVATQNPPSEEPCG